MKRSMVYKKEKIFKKCIMQNWPYYWTMFGPWNYIVKVAVDIINTRKLLSVVKEWIYIL